MSDEAVLLDVLTYGRRAIRAAKEKDSFLRDEIAQSAVAYCISVMGEAMTRQAVKQYLYDAGVVVGCDAEFARLFAMK